MAFLRNQHEKRKTCCKAPCSARDWAESIFGNDLGSSQCLLHLWIHQRINEGPLRARSCVTSWECSHRETPQRVNTGGNDNSKVRVGVGTAPKRTWPWLWGRAEQRVPHRDREETHRSSEDTKVVCLVTAKTHLGGHRGSPSRRVCTSWTWFWGPQTSSHALRRTVWPPEQAEGEGRGPGQRGPPVDCGMSVQMGWWGCAPGWWPWSWRKGDETETFGRQKLTQLLMGDEVIQWSFSPVHRSHSKKQLLQRSMVTNLTTLSHPPTHSPIPLLFLQSLWRTSVPPLFLPHPQHPSHSEGSLLPHHPAQSPQSIAIMMLPESTPSLTTGQTPTLSDPMWPHLWASLKLWP